MPNCDFYATPDDHAVLLRWLFAEKTCDVHELSSEPEQLLRQFRSADEVLALFRESVAVHLQLFVVGAGPPLIPRRVSLNPELCKGMRFRYAAEGWGLVQLNLGSPNNGHLQNSHTNHNSLKRAQAWAGTIGELGAPQSWDFKRINSFSSRMNREVKKQSVATIGRRSILPGALALWEAGVSLAPYKRGEHDSYFKRVSSRSIATD